MGGAFLEPQNRNPYTRHRHCCGAGPVAASAAPVGLRRISNTSRRGTAQPFPSIPPAQQTSRQEAEQTSIETETDRERII